MAEAKHSLAFLLGLLRDRKFLEITSATGCRWRSAEGPILMKGGRFNVYRWAYNCRNQGVRSHGRFWKNLYTLKPGFSTVKLER